MDERPSVTRKPLLRCLGAGGCAFLAILLIAYAAAVLLTYDPAAACTQDLVASAVVNLLLAAGFLLSARFVWQGRKYWLPISLMVYMLSAGFVGIVLFLGLRWAYYASIYVIVIQFFMLVVLVATLVSLIYAIATARDKG